MMKKLLTYITMLVAFCGVLSSCEDIEDTYKEHAGDGPIQYLNKIYDLEATSQWESVLLTWNLKLDPGRTGILVEWKDDTATHSEMLDKDAESFLVEGLTNNYDYEFNVWAVTEENGEIVKKSLGNPVYGRPFNLQSDELSLFTHVVTKQISVADKKLFVIFDVWADNLVSFKIGYFEKGDSDEQFFEAGADDKIGNYPKGHPYAVIGEDIDFTKPVKVYRTGMIESFGNKVLELDPLTLYFDLPTFNSDFANELRPFIGVSGEIQPEDVKDVTSLNLNFDQTSLEDILYLPQLKTVNLGKDRYIMQGTEDIAKSTLSSDVNREISLGALKLAHDVLGVQINQYSKHYFDETPDWFTGKNLTPQLPSLKLLDTFGWEITETPMDAMGYETGLKNLLVDDVQQYWIPTASVQLRTHTFVIDMKKMENVVGFKIVQANINNDTDLQLSELITIELMNASGEWVAAGFNEDVTIGTGKGEASLVYLNKDKTATQAQKIRFKVSDTFYKNGYDANFNWVKYYRTALATFMVIAE
ncbi:hypothetical protein QR305_01128 [Bacteroides finegoldii]|jgi:lipoprotein|uniref:Uncharacterized protein n=1 Tax=Bacteroides finegoldii CL09T03C10 TaxID=997888 RepID=K5BRK6_9BACE|nr:DUF4998 domain-containing protein [Bacteroides finegoldii]EKJ89192.1 hypothetical protein HMPREF1057_03945 [Bacteroides finegoldii CL09T03C10]